jgi:uncharacterized protein (TIGR03435 family)
MTNMSLKWLVARAYGVADFKIVGPGWLDTTAFDIVAKLPAGAKGKDMPIMLRNLLVDRLKLVVREEEREIAIYALVVAKNGPKLTPSSQEASAVGAAASGLDSDGFPRLSCGRGYLVRRTPDGRMRMVGGHMTMAKLATSLALETGRDVADMTGIDGEYDYRLEFSREGTRAFTGQTSTGPPPENERNPAAAASDAAPSLFTALQERLGLKLEGRKAPVKVVVVDSVERTPTEN